MGTRVEELVERAAGLARDADLPTALATLATYPTRDVDAAFALARRRRSSGPRLAGAADLLEASAIARRRTALAPAAALPAVMFGLAGLMVTNFVLTGYNVLGWTGVAVGLAGCAGLVVAVTVAARRQGWWTLDRIDVDGTGRANELAAKAVDVLREDELDDGDATDRLLALGERGGPASPVLALAALRNAELVVAGWHTGRRRRARRLCAATRTALVEQRLDGLGRRQLRRLARHGR